MVCRREQEVGCVIYSLLGVAVFCVGGGEGELERASWVLWFNGAADGEVGELIKHIGGGSDGDHRLQQQICKDKGLVEGADLQSFSYD